VNVLPAGAGSIRNAQLRCFVSIVVAIVHTPS
jgi:hypothetical protein